MTTPSDHIDHFIHDMVVPADDRRLTMTEVYEAYCEWSETRGDDPLAVPSFGRAFGSRFRAEKTNHRIYYNVKIGRRNSDSLFPEMDMMSIRTQDAPAPRIQQVPVKRIIQVKGWQTTDKTVHASYKAALEHEYVRAVREHCGNANFGAANVLKHADALLLILQQYISDRDSEPRGK